MKHWEINGNLADEESGIKNYELFQRTVCQVKRLFDRVFGADQLNRISFSVDNATEGSGYTPISTPILGKVMVIKLGIGPNDLEGKIIFQFAHELTHIVFRSYFGMDKPRATEAEEVVCTAASLMAIKVLCPVEFDQYNQHVKNLARLGYHCGADLAASINYDWAKLKKIVETFHY